MRENFKEQFGNLRLIIQANVSSLRELLKQSESLSKIIQDLNGKTENNALKSQLEELKKGISISIEQLVRQTEDLFRSYDRLVDEVFGNSNER